MDTSGHSRESALLSGILASVSLEDEADLRVWRPPRGWFGRRPCGVAQVERAEQTDLELGEQQGGGGLETAGGGVMQDAQQHKGDQRDVDLDAHGVFTAAEEAADFEVLLEPFEQQLDGPTLLIELSDLPGRPIEIIGQEIKRRVLVGARHDNLAQADIVERVLWRPAARLPVADLDPAVAEDAVARGGLCADLAAMGVSPASGGEERPPRPAPR